MALKLRNSGFTIVELLVVITVISILAALVINSFSGTQAKARDTERSSDVTTFSSHLESFYTNEGYYPTYANASDVAWLQANLKGIDLAALKNPSDKTADPISLINNSTPNQTRYGYRVYDKEDAICNGIGETCGVRFELYYLSEETGSYVVQRSLN